LHRDYQGTILAISDESGIVLEKRAFDAWGSLIKLANSSGITTVPTTEGVLLLDRGYTGHEHLLGVGLINMNGRLYDPKLHRFLSPDNFVQDPKNSQNYNRYGYVLNNPLKYTDPIAWI
jgi:RHS repeat-associated protein